MPGPALGGVSACGLEQALLLEQPESYNQAPGALGLAPGLQAPLESDQRALLCPAGVGLLCLLPE